MILVDTTVWIDHFRHAEPTLVGLLEGGEVLGHRWVTGELALGNLRDRGETLRLLGQLPQAAVATGSELLTFIERHGLAGLGIGYVDTQLLASATLSDGARLWTGDLRLRAAGERLGVAYPADRHG